MTQKDTKNIGGRKLEEKGYEKEFIERQFQRMYGNRIYKFYSEETPEFASKKSH